ncbi:MAG: DNA gyrase/topoisomerase IV subunit A, partial [Bacteroidales bacterium]|nr:DNA gyrase/topoisomerase IV subunit A [Bacteroidales bacterium]
IKTIDKGLDPFKKNLKREVTRDDIIKLTEIKIKRISRYDSNKADELLIAIEEEIEQVQHNLDNIIPYSINYYEKLKKDYGKNFPRMTEIRSFENIEATKVIVQNEKLYINREEGFIGTSLRRDEYICDCSAIDDVIIFYKDGRYVITKVQEKAFVGKNIIHIAIFKRNDKRTIYNVAYRDGKSGISYVKRFAVTAITRDREYNVTQGTPKSEIIYFSANPNGEAEVLKVTLRPKARLRNLIFDYDMSELAIKGRGARGNILTKHAILRIVLKEKGESTLGGRKTWFEPETFRLNVDGRGDYLGEFQNDDSILVITKKGEFYQTNYELTNHYPDDFLIVEKFKEDRVWSAVYYDADRKYHYIKRFQLETVSRPQSIIGDNSDSFLVRLTKVDYPRLEIKFGGADKDRDKEIVEVADFINVMGYKAVGKRLTKYQISKINELEPLIIPEKEEETKPETDSDSPEEKVDDGQMSMF